MKIMITAILLVLVQATVKLDPPPAPDFKTPVDYAGWLERQVVRGQSKDENAAGLYDAIFGPLDAKEIPEIGFQGPRTQDKPVAAVEPWDPKKHPDWEAAYQKTKDKIEQFKRAAAKPYIWWGVRYGEDELPKLLMYGFMPELSRMRGLARGASENAWRAVDGKIDQSAFVAAQRAILGLTRQMERNPTLIMQLVAFSVRGIAYDDLIRAAELGVLSEKQRASVLLLLASRDEPPAPFGYPMTAEMAFSFDLIQHIAMKNGGKFGYSEQADLITLQGSQKTDAPVARDAMKAFLETLVKESGGPYSVETMGRMDAAEKTATNADKLCAGLVPGFSRAYQQRTRCETLRRGTRLVYEILVYQDKNKKWPATLGDLPSEALKAVKIDPYSEKPFVYRLEDGKPLLYSVASNGKDDGGTKHDRKWGDDANDADYIIWPRQKD